MDSSNGDFDTEGPPPPSPLTGCYLLIVVGEPHSEAHKDIILQRIKKGLLSWDRDECLVDLEKELLVISDQALEGELAKNGERLIQFASENLVTEILIHPAVSTLVQCMKNLLGSFTRHRHIIHAGYTFTANGSWTLQDGTFSYTDFLEAFEELESQRVIHAYENGISLDLHCSTEGEWYKLPKESFAKGCIIRVNPSDVLTCGSSAITHFIKYMSQFIIPTSLEDLLECSDVVGNIRFSRPTLYVFPGGQGDAALFGVNGFNMLLDGGFSRKACFWDFVRHLDRIDAVLMTRLNNGNIGGISSIIKRKKKDAIYPHIGHFFCNIPDRKATLSPDGDKDRDPLLIDLLNEGQDLISNLQHLGLTPQVCYTDSEPINLYHKVGHGTLNMYVLNPGRDSKEVKEFLQKWNQSDQKLFCKSHKDFTFPIQNLVSIAVLLIWQPANINDTITRILYPGSTPQNKVFEGLDKIKNIEYIKHPVCSEKTLFPKFSKKKFLKNDILEKTASREKSVEKKQKRDENITVYGADVIEKNVQKRETKKMEEHKLFIENDEKFKENKRIKLKNQQQKKPSFDKKDYSVTPKKIVDQEGLKKSVTAPAKSAKDANNRKVLENKTKSIKSSTGIVKSENKSISRTSKVSTKTPFSPSKRMMNGAQKSNNLLKKGTTDKDGTTDSSTVSTPTADQNSLKKDISNLTLEEIQLKAQELDDLEEEQEAIKEIEAVFKKSEAQLFEGESMRRIKNSPTDEDKSEKEEFVDIEKEQIDSSTLKKLVDIPKLTRDNEESEKLKNTRFYKPSKKEIMEVIKNKENVDVVSGNHEEKVEILSSDKKSDKDTEIKDAVESHPEEKVSANIKSGDTTTAPTLPEDERIPLDDVKEDTANQIEEKYVKEETKEKYVPIIQLPPKAFDCLAKSSAVVGIRLDKQNLIRDIVKTPDEVADLPVHEEVDYEYAQETKTNIKSNDAQDDLQTDIGLPESDTIQQGHAYNIGKEKSDDYKTCDFSTVNEESKQKYTDSNEEKSFQRVEKEDGQIKNGKIHTLNELLKKSNDSISDVGQMIPKENETIGKIQESKRETNSKNKLEDQGDKLAIHQIDVALQSSESKNNNIIFGEVTGSKETPSRVDKSIGKDAKNITESNQDSPKSNEKNETGLSFKENAAEINCRQSDNSLNIEGIKYECNAEKDITKNLSFKQYESEVKGKVNTAEKSDKEIIKNVIFETFKHKESDIDLEPYKSEKYINCTTEAKIKSNLEEASSFDEESKQVREESVKNKNSSDKEIVSSKEEENEGLISRLDIETERHNVHCFEEKEDDLIEDKTDAERLSDFKTQSIGHIFYNEIEDTNVHVKLEKEDFIGGNENTHIIAKGETHQFKQEEEGFIVEDKNKHDTTTDEAHELIQKAEELCEEDQSKHFPTMDEDSQSKQKEKPKYEDEDKNKHITAIDEEYEAKQIKIINEDKNKHITAIDLNYESAKRKVVEYNKEDKIKHITAIDENDQLKQKEKEKEDIKENGSKLTEKEFFEKYKIEDFPPIDEDRHSKQKEKPSYEDEDKNKHITAIDEDYEAKQKEVINDEDKNKRIIAIDKDYESKQKVVKYSGKDDNKHFTAIDENRQLEQKEEEKDNIKQNGSKQKEKECYEENKSKDFQQNDEDRHSTQKEKPNYEEDKNKQIAAIDEDYEAKEKEVTHEEDKNKRITNIDKDHESIQKGIKYNGKDENKHILAIDENHQFNQKEEEKDNIKQKRSNHKETELIEDYTNKHISSTNEDNSSKKKKGEEDTSERITAADEAHQSKQTEKEKIEIEDNRYIPAILKDDHEYKQKEEEFNETDRNRHTETINKGDKPKKKEEEFNEGDKNKQITEIHEEYRSKQKEEFNEDKNHITVTHEDNTSKPKEEFDGENKNEHISAIDRDHKCKQRKEKFNEENKKIRILSTDKDHEPKQKEEELLSLEIHSFITSDIHKDSEKLVDAAGRLEKDHEENVIKIVSTVAEVLKSDASLEELEEKLSLSFDPPKVSCITELRETHITTSELSDKDIGIHSGIILSVSEDNVSIIDENDENKLETNLFNKSLETTRNEYVKETEKQMDSADEQGTVQRMLVTTSSEDGREEIEICPVGTIIFSKSSDSSGRSSPEKSQESKKSSIVDTFSESVITAKEFSEAAIEKSADTVNAAKSIQQENMNIVTEEIYFLDYTPTSVTSTDTVDKVDKTKETYDITNSEQDSTSIKDILELHSVNKIENNKAETVSNIEFEECTFASFEKNKVTDINTEKDIESNVSSTNDNVVEDTKSKIAEYSTSVKEPNVVVEDILLTNNDQNKLESENKEDKRELMFEETEVRSPNSLINKSIDISGDNKQIQTGITGSIDKKLIRSNQPEDYPSVDNLVVEESISSHEVLSNNSNIYIQDKQKEIKEYLMYAKNKNLMEQSVYGSLNDVEEGNSIYLFEITNAKYISRCSENDDIYNGTDNKDSSSISFETDIDVPVIVRNTKKYVETQDLPKPLERSCYLYEITNATYTSTLYEHIDNQNSSKTDKHDRSYAYEITKAQQFTRNTDICKKSSDAIYLPGKPLSLPSPAPTNDNTGTPKKEVKLPSNVASKNKWNDDKKRSEWSLKLKKKTSPIYVDLTYVPHHGNSYYAYVDYFKIVRARYYVFSGVEPGKEVYNALLEAKQTWDDKSLEVTIIPTYDTDILGYWVAENEELLAKYKIDLSPSASRCTINLQDHETSCSAYSKGDIWNILYNEYNEEAKNDRHYDIHYEFTRFKGIRFNF